MLLLWSGQSCSDDKWEGGDDAAVVRTRGRES